jgi:hypothetical protein
MKLAELQSAYRHYLLTGESGQLAPAIIADAFDGAERLGIYRNNFLIGLGEALKANFPITLQLLGRDFFEQAARRFVLTHPPRRPCLFEYGAEFPRYLGGLPELAALPSVADVAELEFARITSYNAPVEEHVTAATLANLSPELLDAYPIRRARHAQIVQVAAPVLELWSAHQAPNPDLSAIDMRLRPHAVLVCRPDRTLVARELDSAAARFLASALDTTRLGTAAEASGTQDEAMLGRTIALALELRLLVKAAA